jgi:hypothetical protein
LSSLSVPGYRPWHLNRHHISFLASSSTVFVENHQFPISVSFRARQFVTRSWFLLRR